MVEDGNARRAKKDSKQKPAKEIWRILQPDAVRAIVGYTVVFAAIGAFLFAVFIQRVNEAKIISEFFQAMVGVVLGFFFGRIGVDTAEKATFKAKRELEGVVEKTEGAQVEEITKRLLAAEDVAKKYRSVVATMLEDKDPHVQEKVQKAIEAIGN